MADWQTKSSNIVYETAWFKIRRDEVLNQHGKALTYSYMELQNPSVFIIAMNAQNEILLQNGYRYPIRARVWEIPAGFTDSGEDFLAAAKRELQEGSNLVSDDWRHLGRLQQITGTGNVPVELFLAKNVQPGNNQTDQDEDITDRQFFDMATIERMAASAKIVDMPVLAALYMVKIHNSSAKEKA